LPTGPPDALLISQLRPADADTLDYVESFLKDPAAIAGWKGRALLAVGMLNAQQWRDRLVQVALGDFTSINARKDDPRVVTYGKKRSKPWPKSEPMSELQALRSSAKASTGRLA